MTHSIRSKYQANKVSVSVLWDRFYFSFLGNWKYFFHRFGCASKHLHGTFLYFLANFITHSLGTKNCIDSIRCHSKISHVSWLSMLCVLIFNWSHWIFALFGYIHLIVYVEMLNIYLFCLSICLCGAIEQKIAFSIQCNTICTRERKTNQIEHVVWVTREEDVCVCV